MKKWLKVTLIVVGALLLTLVMLSVLAGPIAKRYAEKHSMELCHRTATIGKVRANIFTGAVTIDTLKVMEEQGNQVFLSFNRLKVNASLPKLLVKEVKISKIYLDGLKAEVVQDGKRFNFTDIIELYTKKPKKEKKDTPSKWAVNLLDIQIHNSAISYKDAQVGSHFGLNNLDLVVPQLYLAGGHSDIKLDLDFDEGGALALKLLYDIKKSDYNLDVKMTKFNVNAVQPYLANNFNIADFQGLMTGDIAVTGSLEHILNLVASGKVALSNLKVTHLDKSPLLSMKSLKLDIEKVDLQNQDYSIRSLLLDGMLFHYDIFKDGNTLSRLKKQKSGKENTSDASEDSKKQLTYQLQNLTVSNGKVVYEDHTLSQKMSFPVNDIQMVVNDLRTGQAANITLDAKLGQTGILKCTGQANPMDLSNASLDVDIKNLSIKEFSPYSMYYLAYPIQDGLLAFHSKDVIKSNWLKSENNLDIFKPTFGNKQKDVQPRANIPMKAAMYLITDRKGHVQMDLPVSGDISSPSFSFRKIIWKTFTNLLVKVMLSPVDFVANMAGDNVFSPMKLPTSNSMQLSMENCHQLNSMAEVLKEKEQMHLVISAACPVVNDATGNASDSPYREKGFALVKNYLVSQGVSSDRVRLSDDAASSQDGNVKLSFNLEIPE